MLFSLTDRVWALQNKEVNRMNKKELVSNLFFFSVSTMTQKRKIFFLHVWLWGSNQLLKYLRGRNLSCQVLRVWFTQILATYFPGMLIAVLNIFWKCGHLHSRSVNNANIFNKADHWLCPKLKNIRQRDICWFQGPYYSTSSLVEVFCDCHFDGKERFCFSGSGRKR